MINSNLKQSFYDKYMPYLMAVLLLIGGTILGWWGYRFYRGKVAQSAFKDLAETIESFDKYVASNRDKQTTSGVDKLGDLERAFITGAKKYSNTKLIPFFYLYKADTLIQKGDINAALDALNFAADKIEKGSSFYYLLLTKKALLQTDNDLFKEQGLKELEDLAWDRSNPFAPMSAYYLGLYYYHLNEDKEHLIKAKTIWLAELNRQKNLVSAKESSWTELIRAKLKNISQEIGK